MNLYSSRGAYTIDSSFHEKIQAIIYSPDLNEIDKKFDEDDVVMLFRAFDELRKELALVKLENEVLEFFMETNDPTQLEAMRDKEMGTKKQVKITFALESPDGRLSVLLRQSRIDGLQSFSQEEIGYISGRSSTIRTRHAMSISTNIQRESIRGENSINYVMKRELVEKLCFKIEEESKAVEASGRSEIIRLNAVQTELSLRVDEVRETERSLEEIVVSRRQGNMTFKIPSETFIRYCESWAKNGLALISTMRIKINALNRQWAQQKSSLARKIDLSGALLPVDFELMTINRDQHDKIMNDKNNYIMKLKVHSGEVALKLTKQRKILMALESTLREINFEVDITKRYIEEVQRDALEVEEEIEKSTENYKALKEQIKIYAAPSIRKYINKKQELQSIQKEEKLLQRQNYILGIKLQNIKNKSWQGKNQRKTRK